MYVRICKLKAILLIQLSIQNNRNIYLLFITVDLAEQQMGKPNKKAKEPSPSPSDEEQEVEELDSESMVEHVPEEMEQEMQEKIVENILEHANKAKDGEKLTWNAIYSLKLKQMDLSEQLNSEIEKIKEKYELLKQPIYHKISAVALGQKVSPSLYSPPGLQNNLDPSKVVPQKVEDFWGIVLDKEGLLTQVVDVDCVKKLNYFRCELLNHATNHIRISFKFEEETDYFKNKSLVVQSRYDSEKNEPVRQIKQVLVYKKQVVDHSLFTLLFDPKTDINEFYNVAVELYQDYANALYFYFREEEEELEDNVIQEHQNEDEQQDDDDEEVQPVKKVKPDTTAKPTEKPQCKNQ